MTGSRMARHDSTTSSSIFDYDAINSDSLADRKCSALLINSGGFAEGHCAQPSG